MRFILDGREVVVENVNPTLTVLEVFARDRRTSPVRRKAARKETVAPAPSCWVS